MTSIARGRAATATLVAVALLLPMTVADAREVRPEDVGGDVAVERIAGVDRLETAALAAAATFPAGAVDVLLARADRHPDALAASYLAGDRGAPLLLTDTAALSPRTEQALEELGVSRVTILGGVGAVSAAVEARLRQLGLEVDRLDGATRYETMAAIARAGTEIGRMPGPDGELVPTALLVTGEAFADATSVGPLAVGGRLPVVLTEGDELHAEARELLVELGVEQVVLVGGTRAIGPAVEAAVSDLVTTVRRVAGDSRWATSVAVAELTRAWLGWLDGDVAIATGDDFPDALTVSALAASRQAPLLLTPGGHLHRATHDHLATSCDGIDRLTVAGGGTVVTPTAEAALVLASSCPDLTSLLGRPATAAHGIARLHVQEDATLCLSVVLDRLTTPATRIVLATGPVDAPTGEAAAVAATGDLTTACLDPDDAGLVELAGVLPQSFHLAVDTPAGMLTGPLVDPEERRLASVLVADPDGGDPSATGLVAHRIVGDRVCLSVLARGLTSSATSITLRSGIVGEVGEVVAAIDPGLPRTSLDTATCVVVGASTAAAIAADPEAFHVLIGTTDRPAGALRGQLGAFRRAWLSGAAVHDGDGTFDLGEEGVVGTVDVHVGDDILCVVSDVPLDADEVVLRSGAADELGSELLRLDLGGGDSACADVDALVRAEVRGGPERLHLVLPTEDFPDGAVRGQLGADLSSRLSGAAVPGGAGDPFGVGTLLLFAGGADGVLCSFIEVTLPTTRASEAHLHETATGVQVDLAPPSSLDHAAGCSRPGAGVVDRLLRDPDGFRADVHTEQHPAGALSGVPS